MADEVEPAGDVHFAEHRGAPEAACGASLFGVGATFRTFADDGVTCQACRAAMPDVQ